MSSRVQILQEMEALLGRHGISLDTVSVGISLSGHPSTTNIHLHAEVLTPQIRESLVGELGQPERPAYDRKLARWNVKNSFHVFAYHWPWPTCDSCGQNIPENTPVPSGG